jgi:hypothetical protein
MFFNQRIENSQLTSFDIAKQPQSSFVIELNIFTSQYSLRGVSDLCDQ